jgi:hypothetical protein
MAIGRLRDPYNSLMAQLCETFLASGRSGYPQSMSDLELCMLGVIQMFDIKRRPLALERKEIFPLITEEGE